MTSHELGLANGIEQNCRDLLAEIYILAFEDLVSCFRGVLPGHREFSKKLSLTRQSELCRIEASRIYRFFTDTLSEDGRPFSPKIFLKRACIQAGISYEEGLNRCQTKVET